MINATVAPGTSDTTVVVVAAGIDAAMAIREVVAWDRCSAMVVVTTVVRVVGVNSRVMLLCVAKAIAVSVSTVRVPVTISINQATCCLILCVAFAIIVVIETNVVLYCIAFTVTVGIKAEVVCVVFVGVLDGLISTLTCLEFMDCFDAFFLVICLVSNGSKLCLHRADCST